MILFMNLFISCDKDLKHALDIAGNNRTELEAVLRHFENDPNPLKYESAKFLIENMPNQFQIVGPTIDAMDSIYIKTSGESLNIRTKFFEAATSGIATNQYDVAYDITTMKTDYLIKAINDACEAWSNSTWNKDFDKSLILSAGSAETILPILSPSACITQIYL